ncbi:MAG: malate synthase A [Reyranella sp.]|uniref:malate synthase A n=1 Tax=Reyranella sp. TaxID=1929291 RepID=UPI003D0D7F60
MALDLPAGVVIHGAIEPGYDKVLTPEVLAFLADLQRRFNPQREALLAARAERQLRLDAGEKPDFLAETAGIREDDWTVAPLPADLLDRRVEITGPVDRKMIINALNCGADVFMADFEDASTPTWANMIEGQANLVDAVRRSIELADPETGRDYKLNDRTAVLFVRPRGWHLVERHMTVDGQAMSGSLFDFGLYFFHNAREALARGTGPYFYLPKIESHLEARLWNDVFVYAQDVLGVPQGSIKATVLIETILAAFEMDEILWELRQHSAGLNCGRWDYIFSFIKKFREQAWSVLPDRGQVTMTAHFLRCYSQLLIKTCHRREVHAMGGMAAQIPIRNDGAANEAAMERVRADKKREAGDGHDGTWVAHPGLVAIARAEFDAIMKGSNQIARKRQDVHVGAADLIAVPEGSKTEAGLRHNVAVGIGYLEAWLRGIGCVPLFNLMEDAATAEISRAQVWQWLRHGQTLEDGRAITADLVRTIVREENERVQARIGDEAYALARYEDAARLLLELVESPTFEEFLTLPAYGRIVAEERVRDGQAGQSHTTKGSVMPTGAERNEA